MDTTQRIFRPGMLGLTFPTQSDASKAAAMHLGEGKDDKKQCHPVLEGQMETDTKENDKMKSDPIPNTKSSSSSHTQEEYDTLAMIVYQIEHCTLE